MDVEKDIGVQKNPNEFFLEFIRISQNCIYVGARDAAEREWSANNKTAFTKSGSFRSCRRKAGRT
jgi:hypothetical protein